MLKALLLAGVVVATFAPIDHARADAGLHVHHASFHAHHASFHAHHASFHAHHASSHRSIAPRRHAFRTRSDTRSVAHGHRSTPSRHAATIGGQTGKASYYQGGRTTANGTRVGPATCAHPTLPFGTRVRVTNLGNARQAILTVNDRGPFVRGRIVDVSTVAAGLLGILHAGTALVRVEVVGPG